MTLGVWNGTVYPNFGHPGMQDSLLTQSHRKSRLITVQPLCDRCGRGGCDWVVLIMLGVFETKTTCSQHVHVHRHTRAQTSWNRRVHPSTAHKPTEIILVEHGQVGLTVNSIILKDIYCQSHNSQGYLSLDPTSSSRAPSVNLCLSVPPSFQTLLQTSKYEFQKQISKKIWVSSIISNKFIT